MIRAMWVAASSYHKRARLARIARISHRFRAIVSPPSSHALFPHPHAHAPPHRVYHSIAPAIARGGNPRMLRCDPSGLL